MGTWWAWHQIRQSSERKTKRRYSFGEDFKSFVVPLPLHAALLHTVRCSEAHLTSRRAPAAAGALGGRGNSFPTFPTACLPCHGLWLRCATHNALMSETHSNASIQKSGSSRKTSKEKAPKSVWQLWLVTSVKVNTQKTKNTERGAKRRVLALAEEEEHPEDISSALRRVCVLRRNALHDWDRQNQE